MNSTLTTTLDLKSLARVLGAPDRWTLLGELARGAALPVSELARRAGISREQCSKHMITMKSTGLVVQGWGRLYAMAPGFAPVPGTRDLRLGACTLHFPA
jgi:predicted transcriptional regulator